MSVEHQQEMKERMALEEAQLVERVSCVVRAFMARERVLGSVTNLVVF